MKEDEPHDVRQLQVRDGRCFRKTAGGGRRRQATVENCRDGGGLTGCSVENTRKREFSRIYQERRK